MKQYAPDKTVVNTVWYCKCTDCTADIAHQCLCIITPGNYFLHYFKICSKGVHFDCLELQVKKGETTWRCTGVRIQRIGWRNTCCRTGKVHPERERLHPEGSIGRVLHRQTGVRTGGIGRRKSCCRTGNLIRKGKSSLPVSRSRSREHRWRSQSASVGTRWADSCRKNKTINKFHF